MEAGYSAAEKEGDDTAGQSPSSPLPQWRQKLSGTLDSTELQHRLDKDRRPRVVLFVIMNAILVVFLICVALTWVGLGIVKKHRTYALAQAGSQGSTAQSLQG